MARAAGEKARAGDKTKDHNLTAHETLDERLLHRLLFFTDAVFAIVLTLMVLELKPPGVDNPLTSPAALQAVFEHLFAFGMSFAVISIFWLAHLSTTRRMIHFDWPSAVANLAFLLPICLLPFATGWWGSAIAAAFPWGVYCAVMAVTSLANIVLVLVVARGGGRLISGGCTPAETRYRVVRAASPGIAFGLGVVLLLAQQVRLAQFCWVLIPVLLALATRFMKPPAQPLVV